MTTTTKSSESGFDPRIKITHLSFTTTYKADINDDKCGICREGVMNVCADCSDVKNQTFQCNFSRGKCDHGFHYHCIQKCLKNNGGICPTCKVSWSFKYQNSNLDKLGNFKK